MKTIKQIADELGVSKQAVQKRMSREPLYTCLYPYISTKQGTKYIEDIGENLIKQAFSENEPITKPPVVADNVHIDTTNDVHTLISMLQQELNVKNKQLDELQQNNRELTAALKNTTDSLKAAHSLHAGTIHKQLTGISIERSEEEPPTAHKESDKLGFLERVKQFFK